MKNLHPSPLLVCLSLVLVVAAACYPPATPVPPSTPTVEPDIYNVAPDTTVYEPGECSALLDSPAPAYSSNT